MSDNFSELIERLNSDYVLEALSHLQEQHEGDCAKAGREKVKKAVALAKSKGGFSNTTVAKYFKEEVLHELIDGLHELHKRGSCVLKRVIGSQSISRCSSISSTHALQCMSTGMEWIHKTPRT